MSLKDYLPGDKKNNKTIKVNHPKDHPDVQNIADKKYDKMKKKIFGGVGMLGDNIKKSRKMDAKATKEAKKFMDTVQTMKSKKMSEKMGSFAGGGSIRGYGAARTSGMGLQDEQLSPGKVYKAKRGSGLDLPVINSVKPTVNKTKRAQNLSRMKIQFTKQKNRAGINSGTLDKILSKTKNPYSDLKATTAKGPKNYMKSIGVFPKVSGSPVASKFTERRMKLAGPFSSMAEMRTAKGFKTINGKQETSSEFNKRRMKLAGATKALKATRVGKIALGVAAAGIGAKKYLESKMNKKKDVEKKMGGGMMKKYNEGGVSSKTVYLNARANLDAEGRKYMNMNDIKEAQRETYAITKDRYNKSSSDKDTLPVPMQQSKKNDTRQQKRQDETRRRILSRPDRQVEIPERLKRSRPKRVVGRNMGGMMQKPMGYSKGTMIKARGCKLGRTRPTKIT